MNIQNPISVGTIVKTLKQKGDLRYEYNPLYNYRTKVREYKSNVRGWICKDNGGKLSPVGMGITLDLLSKNVNPNRKLSDHIFIYDYYEDIQLDVSKYRYYSPLTNSIIGQLLKNDIFLEGEFYEFALGSGLIPNGVKNEIGDMTNSHLDFDLNHPVDILIQDSYDGSVNLILNDDKNYSKLINSRFSVTENDTYQIPQRLNDNDANLYDDTEWESDTRLQKTYKNIPELKLVSVSTGGNFKVGNYVFYFRYLDADENATDYIVESGIVSCFIGNTPTTINSGWKDMNSHKLIEFQLSNLDLSYKALKIFYSRSTSDIDGIESTIYEEIVPTFKISSETERIVLTGFENTVETTWEVINAQYHRWDSAKTQAALHNHLFIGNLEKQHIDYKDLIDLSYRIYPSVYVDEKVKYEEFYYSTSYESSGYYNTDRLYNKTGYWPEEYYRFGIVYILSNNELSPVFDVSGYHFDYIKDLGDYNLNSPYEHHISEADLNTMKSSSIYKRIPGTKKFLYEVNQDGDYIRQYLPTKDNYISNTSLNTKGVVKMPACDDNNAILGIKFNIPEEVFTRLAQLTKGYFFVRQKRIPTILCQGIVAGLDNVSHLPMIKDDNKFFLERFVNNQGYLVEDYNQRLYKFEDGADSVMSNRTMFAPEVNVNLQFFNQFFTGEDYICRKINAGDIVKSTRNERSYIRKSPIKDFSFPEFEQINIINVTDGTKIITNQNLRYSARAGEPEEAWRFSFVGERKKAPKKPKVSLGTGIVNKIKSWFKGVDSVKEPFYQHTNMVRGMWGTYCGIDKYGGNYADLLNIYIPGYAQDKYDDYMAIRMADKSPYYAITERRTYEDMTEKGLYAIQPEKQKPCYRGDCFICQYTHRINRNHIDPETPLNDEIIAEDTWALNFKQGDLESNNKIIRGDVNAVPVGTWITMTVRSSINLCVRGVDLHHETEAATFGHGRTFYPLVAMSTDSVYKIPESAVHNAGFSSTTSDKINSRLPEIPYIRNEFDTRILFSNIHINSSFQNGFRVFNWPDFVDYPKEYGSLTKIIAYGNYLIAVFDHGVLKISVKERAAASGADGTVFINADKLITDHGVAVISNKFGSSWKDSICESEGWVYGVDTVAKKIWRTNGQEMETISDFTIQSFLNYNIDLKERESLPIEGIRNVKTHFNAFKHDVMFTFYNASRGIQETAWNLCYNELTGKFTTFYSWLPSQSENIDNMYFSFNRKVSKWIAKIADSSMRYKPANGLLLEEPIIADYYLSKSKKYLDIESDYFYVLREYAGLPILKVELAYWEEEVRKLENRNIQLRSEITKLQNQIEALKLEDEIAAKNSEITSNTALIEKYRVKEIQPRELKIDSLENKIDSLTVNFGGYLMFRDNEDEHVRVSKFEIDETDLNAKYFKLEDATHPISGEAVKELTFNLVKYLSDFNVNLKDINTSEDLREAFKEAYYNRKSEEFKTRRYFAPIFQIDLITKKVRDIIYRDTGAKIIFDYVNKNDQNTQVIDLGIESKKLSITLECLLEDYKRDALFSTDFWKHGQAGLFDLQDDILPTNWYGEQHPFEFEFVVNDTAGINKIIDNLFIISNNAEPESFHFTVIGDGYTFSNDKSNIYFRQEATKSLLQRNGFDISYDKAFRLHPTKRLAKSTYLQKEYERQDALDELYDTYYLKQYANYDYGNRTGTEVIYDRILNEYALVTSQRAISIDNKYVDHIEGESALEVGRLRGNMQYREGVWRVEVRPSYLTQRNEETEDWVYSDINECNIPPIVLPYSGFLQEPLKIARWIPGYSTTNTNILIPHEELYTLYPGVDTMPPDVQNDIYKGVWSDIKSFRISDKYIKVRIRYSGKKLSVIQAIRTAYTPTMA